MSKKTSSITEAQKFTNEHNFGIFNNVTPDELRRDIEARINNSLAVHQGEDTNFCWAAAITSILWEDDPRGLAAAVIDLYNDGIFNYESVVAKSTQEVRKAVDSYVFYDNDGLTNVVDQMLFMTLAEEDRYRGWINRFNRDYDPGDEGRILRNWAGRTFKPIEKLYRHFGYDLMSFGTDLGNDGNFDFYRASEKYIQSYHIILYVNAKQFKGMKQNSLHASHYLRLMGITEKQGENITLEYWDYGQSKPVTMSIEEFNDCVYGIFALNKPENNA
ncbi:hypothetical protein BKI52_26545 [marine bacterium AO1-C]|nr:hypothetical protein BKI52_26545 [marine bacterium AO1-C]